MAFDWKNYVPSIGDERYKKSPFKPAIDFLRVLYYAHYSVDPSINHVDDNVVFYDPSLPIYGECYSVRGKFPFRIFFQSKYDGCLPDDTWTIAIKVDDKNLNDDNLIFAISLINRFTGKNPNLIVSDMKESKSETTIAFISKMDLICEAMGESKSYLDFFERLCDNNCRNIIYIGDDMKIGVSEDIINKVNSDFVERHKEILSDVFHIKLDELEIRNEYIRGKLLIKKGGPYIPNVNE